VILKLLAETVGESSETALLHPQGQIRAINIGRGNVPRPAALIAPSISDGSILVQNLVRSRKSFASIHFPLTKALGRH